MPENKKILFIEDELGLQKSMNDILVPNGYTVVQAFDGETGLKQAIDEKPDLILLDLILPRKNGFEVLTTLKEQAETKEIPVIVLTNLEGAEEVEKALSLGATTYLVKANYSLEEVLQKMNTVLGDQPSIS